MFDNEIEFSAHEDYFALKEDYPTPIKLNIPEWYKKLEHNVNNVTIKGCIPFLDSLTSGYLLKTPQDFYINHNVDNLNEKGETVKDSNFSWGLHDHKTILWSRSVNLNSQMENHSTEQLAGSPLIEKNKNLPFYKILNPWKIKTPQGYSCLFVPPLNNSDDRFSIIPAIVDTDTFPNEINFPIVINGDKYPFLKTTIKKSTPYVQIIPFKRENWKMSFKPRKQKEVQNSRLFYGLQLLSTYKDKYWSKKSWK
jgi:hypothetical protein